MSEKHWTDGYYDVQYTDRTGHWRTIFQTPRKRRALVVARQLSVKGVKDRRRMTIRVTRDGYHHAGWINGQPAWGLAWTKAAIRSLRWVR